MEKKLGVIFIDGEEQGNCATDAVSWVWTAYLHAPLEHVPEGDDTYLDLYPDPIGGDLHKVIKEAEDLLYLEGYTHARIVDDFGKSEHRLYASRRRVAAKAARIAQDRRQKKRIARARCNAHRRVRRARALITQMANPSPQTIRSFFRGWKKVTGYGPGKDSVIRTELSTAKTALMRHVLSLAQGQGWTYGQAHDMRVQNGYSSVLYVDTPQGQVSFHFLPGALGDLPQYAGKWSGQCDTAQILGRLFEPIQQRLPLAA
jgi:hypothetical protein